LVLEEAVETFLDHHQEREEAVLCQTVLTNRLLGGAQIAPEGGGLMENQPLVAVELGKTCPPWLESLDSHLQVVEEEGQSLQHSVAESQAWYRLEGEEQNRHLQGVEDGTDLAEEVESRSWSSTFKTLQSDEIAFLSTGNSQ